MEAACELLTFSVFEFCWVFTTTTTDFFLLIVVYSYDRVVGPYVLKKPHKVLFSQNITITISTITINWCVRDNMVKLMPAALDAIKLNLIYLVQQIICATCEPWMHFFPVSARQMN